MVKKANHKSFKHDLGAAMIEAVIGLPSFLFVLFNGVQMVVSLYSMLAIETSLARTLRQAIVNPNLNRVAAIEAAVINTGRTFGVHFTAEEIQVCQANQTSCPENESAGGPNDYISVNVRKEIPLLFRLGVNFQHPVGQELKINYAFRVISRNEPF